MLLIVVDGLAYKGILLVQMLILSTCSSCRASLGQSYAGTLRKKHENRKLGERLGGRAPVKGDGSALRRDERGRGLGSRAESSSSRYVTATATEGGMCLKKKEQ